MPVTQNSLLETHILKRKYTTKQKNTSNISLTSENAICLSSYFYIGIIQRPSFLVISFINVFDILCIHLLPPFSFPVADLFQMINFFEIL